LAWGSAGFAAPPADWPYEQHFVTPASGLVKLSLPAQTLDAARGGLEDLRLYDENWTEVPYLVERPGPAARITGAPKSFRVSLTANSTVVTMETGLGQPLDGVTLETPARGFMKAVQVEGSTDGHQWQTLDRGQPVFRQPDGPSQLHLSVVAGPWSWLRLTMDDQRTSPVPFTGARVYGCAAEPVPTEKLPVRMGGRQENPGESRLTLYLDAANVDLAAIHIQTPEPLFTRQVRLAAAQVSEDAIREQTLAEAVLYRVGVDGLPAGSNLEVRVESRVPSRELLLLVRNQDSPPLPITSVSAERRPVHLVFPARSPGLYHLLTGNNRCPAPSYDLAGLAGNFKGVPVSPLEISAPAGNPSYRAPEVLLGLLQGGAPLDVSAWRFRKEVKLNRAGAQQLELDLDVLARASRALSDLRLVRAGRQLPFIVERTSISRSITPVAGAAQDPKHPQLQRWTLKLPRPGLPLVRLVCAARSPLFERRATLYEEVADDRGEKYRRPLGAVSWVQTPDRAAKDFRLTLDNPPMSDTLVMETDNGDNPAIELGKFELFYTATRIRFKAQPGEPLFLYYGNPGADAPRYDLSLVAGQLLAADKSEALLGAEELLKNPSWREAQTPGTASALFWGILAMVVVVLLVIIFRLLPKAPPG